MFHARQKTIILPSTEISRLHLKREILKRGKFCIALVALVTVRRLREMPNYMHLHLTNLDSWYAYRQLKNFKKGIRGYLPQDSTGVQMATMAQSLKDTTEMQDLIAYIETLADVKLGYHRDG